MNDIFKLRDLGVCKSFQSDGKTAFTCYKIDMGEEIWNRDLPLNYILFLLEGKVEISCNEFKNHQIQPSQMILLLRTSAVHVKFLEGSLLCVMYFDTFFSVCDQHLFRSYLPDVEKMKYVFLPTRIPEPITAFLRQISSFQELGVDCTCYNDLKHREFFVLLRHLCSREEIVMFLSPLICSSLRFRSKVLDKYMQLGDGHVTELAGLVGMGRKNFDKRFHEEFGIPPAKWMQQEKAKHLRHFLMEPDVTIADAMDKFYFNSASHFNRFCLHHFNQTPGKIIHEAQEDKKNER